MKNRTVARCGREEPACGIDLQPAARLYNPAMGERRSWRALLRSRQMSMDFETVRFLRIIFAVVFAVVGGAAGMKYLPMLVAPQPSPLVGPAVGAVVGALVGWNAVDLVKGRAHK